MKLNSFIKWGVLAAAAATVLAPSASAESLDLGDQADVDVVDIEIEQHWTVDDLQPSSDAISYRPTGSLWEATVTAELDHGGVPVISGFAARSGAENYPVLWGVASPLGIPPSPLSPGGTATGKIYFDVTGDAPTSVVYTVDGTEPVVWGGSG